MNWTCPSCREENSKSAHFCAQCGAPFPGGPVQSPPAPQAPDSALHPPPSIPSALAPPHKGGSGTKVLIFLGLGGLLLFCCIAAGIVAAIAVPNFLDAKQKGKQKKATEEIQTMVDAVQAYCADNGGLYPDTGHEPSMYYTTVDAEKLVPFLVPKYVAMLPAKDPWENPYQYGVSPDDSAFILICAGKDGKTKLEEVPQEPVETHCYEDDILWEGGRFLQAPGGAQKRCS